MKRIAAYAFFAFATALGLSATPLAVTWAEGKVELEKGSAWVPLGIGDNVDSSATIRLAKGASVELAGGPRKLSLAAEGSYALGALLAKGAQASARSSAALDKLGKLVDPRASVGTTAVAAVRGAAVEPSEAKVEWQTDIADYAGLMEEGKRLVREGEFATASRRFDEAAEIAEGADKDAASYAEAWALAADGSEARAIALLRAMPASGNWAGPRALLLARLDIDSGASAEARGLIQQGIDAALFTSGEDELARALLNEASAN